MRCAIYTRKSTEEGLERDFNSLQAQREACEAFIKSQRQEGWRLLPDAYDDGGFSGGTLERPGLQRLLEAVRARRLEAVVVYKVDRLSRSLTDFAKLVELFETAGVSFVSVTQQFNTTTSMGRLTLNVLLSFAQFEREVTAERIRDKIAASKRKGLWTGGPAPLGYDIADKRLVVNAEEAENVRALFRLYLEFGSVRRLQEAAAAQGLVTKRRQRKDGSVTGGRTFTRGNLYQLLSNPLYVGEVRHKGQNYPGQHQAILERETWEAVQAQLQRNASNRRSGRNVDAPTLLTGLVYDETGDRLRPTHANKQGRRYRYYVSGRLIHAESRSTGGWRLPAKALEAIVIEVLVGWLKDPPRLTADLSLEATAPQEIGAMLAKARELANHLGSGTQTEQRAALRSLVQRIDLSADRLRLSLQCEVFITSDVRQARNSKASVPEVTAPLNLRRRGVEAKIVLISNAKAPQEPDPYLVRLIARAHHWLAQLASGAMPSVRTLAERECIDRSDASRILALAFLAPDITEAILTGTQPLELTARRLHRFSLPPLYWSAQRRRLGLVSSAA